MIITSNKYKGKKIKSYNLGLVIKKKNIIFFKKKKINIKNILLNISKYNFFIKGIIKDISIKILANKKEIEEIKKFIILRKKIRIINIFLKNRLFKLKLGIYNREKYKKKIKLDL
ncbi:hypothetical protein ACT2CC_00535 [Candidatus Vidania fulgoroideorum]